MTLSQCSTFKIVLKFNIILYFPIISSVYIYIYNKSTIFGIATALSNRRLCAPLNLICDPKTITRGSQVEKKGKKDEGEKKPSYPQLSMTQRICPLYYRYKKRNNYLISRLLLISAIKK